MPNSVQSAAISIRSPRARPSLRTSPGVLVNHGEGHRGDLVSRNLEHGDVEVHVEFMVPEGSNSGVYLQGRYEIQILDSHGKPDPQHDDCGGVYQRWDDARGSLVATKARPPRVPMPPGRRSQWQSNTTSSFRAPRFDADGNKIVNARSSSVWSTTGTVHPRRRGVERSYASGVLGRSPPSVHCDCRAITDRSPIEM